MIRRRHTLQLALVNGLALFATRSLHAQTSTDVAALLRAGGCVVMLRHAQTEPGIGDPPDFRIDQCSTQRNLNAEGRAQAAAIGQWFASRALQPSSVQSSAWCRCKDTASLAFGRFDVLASLGSTFDARSRADAQTAVLRARLSAIAPGTFEVWVTHQVNVSALTGEGPSMGEAFIVRASPRDGSVQILARTRFS